MLCSDYRDMGHLDRYEAEGIDAEFQDAGAAEDVMAARMSAERELRKRDIREARRRGLPGALEGAPQRFMPPAICFVHGCHAF